MKHLFRKHQWLLLSFANSPFGREYLNIPKGEKILKLSPNSYHKLIEKNKDTLTLKADFKTYDIYAEKLNMILTTYDLLSDKIVGFKDALDVFGKISTGNYKGILHLTSTFTSNTGEGRIDRGNDAAWADARNAVTGTSTAATINVYSATGFYIVRTFFPIDTSSLTSGALITAGANTFAVYRDDSLGSGFFNGDTTRVELVQTTQASGTALATSDYSLITFTSGGNFTYASTTNNTLKTITLNSTADSWISKTGHTKLALISGRDFDNSAPTGTNQIYFQSRTGTNKPTLSVTYTVVGGILASEI